MDIIITLLFDRHHCFSPTWWNSPYKLLMDFSTTNLLTYAEGYLLYECQYLLHERTLGVVHMLALSEKHSDGKSHYWFYLELSSRADCVDTLQTVGNIQVWMSDNKYSVQRRESSETLWFFLFFFQIRSRIVPFSSVKMLWTTTSNSSFDSWPMMNRRKLFQYPWKEDVPWCVKISRNKSLRAMS